MTLKDSGTENLLALHGQGSPFFLFLGHTDVVSPGNTDDWSSIFKLKMLFERNIASKSYLKILFKMLEIFSVFKILNHGLCK